MGEFLAYALIAGIYLFVGWSVYRLCLSSRKQPCFNRVVIKLIYLVSFSAGPLGKLFSEYFPDKPLMEEALNFSISTDILYIGVITPETPVWVILLVWVYYVGAFITSLITLTGMVRLINIIRNGERINENGFTIIVTDSKLSIPFSWRRYIVVGKGQIPDKTGPILLHELSHIRHRHWLDLIIAQSVCIIQWFNPAAWRLRSDLAMIHEYQADEDVLSTGVDAREYQLLLLSKVCGNRKLTLLANNLNTNHLKKRITMMKKKESKPMGRMRVLAFLPALAVAFWITRTPAVASVITETSDAHIPAVVNMATSATTEQANPEEPVQKNEDKVYEIAEVLPEFPGGMVAMTKWLRSNIVFPESMNEVTGRVIVQFVVNKEGQVTDPKIIKSLSPEADAEAKRVVLAMPAWQPGTVKGKPVDCRFVLPISFKMESDDEDSAAQSGHIKLSAVNNGVSADLPEEEGKVEYSSVSIDGKTVMVWDAGVSLNFDAKADDAPEIYVNDEKYTGSLQEITPADIELMRVEKQESKPNRIYIYLKKK